MEKIICDLCVLPSRYFILLRANKTTVTIKAIKSFVIKEQCSKDALTMLFR